MPQYLVAINHPDNYDPSIEGECDATRYQFAQQRDGGCRVRVFVGGLSWAPSAKSLRAEADGKVVITDGPYQETKEQVGGFWVLEVANLDDALPWGRKAAVACPAPA
jgi:hypothetical protein